MSRFAAGFGFVLLAGNGIPALPGSSFYFLVLCGFLLLVFASFKAWDVIQGFMPYLLMAFVMILIVVGGSWLFERRLRRISEPSKAKLEEIRAALPPQLRTSLEKRDSAARDTAPEVKTSICEEKFDRPFLTGLGYSLRILWTWAFLVAMFFLSRGQLPWQPAMILFGGVLALAVGLSFGFTYTAHRYGEKRARYALIVAFAVLALAIGSALVWWIEIHHRQDYKNSLRAGVARGRLSYLYALRTLSARTPARII